MAAGARRLAAIVFTDVADYTAMAQADEAGTLRLVRALEGLIRPVLALHHGRHVKSMGDGLLLEFPSALEALQGAVEIQRRIHELPPTGGAPPVRLRIGIHLGDVEERDNDVLGDAVNIASRIESAAEPGSICFSSQVFDQVRNKVPYRLQGLGPTALKGLRSPVELYRVVLPWDGADRGTAVEGPSSLPRLAVLPLANISPDAKDEYFADGLTEELIAVLSRIQGLRVIARTSVSHYKSTSRTIAQIGEELGVTSVLEGSVRKAGNRLRITLQLIDVASQEHRWAESYDRELDDVFAIQSQVAEQTASALRLELLGRERDALRRRPTSNMEAYQHFLQGIFAYHQTFAEMTPRNVERTVGYFEAALAADPQFAAAHAYIANILIAAGGEEMPSREAFARARRSVDRALELDASSSEAWSARGNLLLQAETNWEGAEQALRTAISLNPSNSSAHFWYGFLLGSLQRYDEALREFESVVQLDPLWGSSGLMVIRGHQLSGDFERAAQLASQLIDRHPDLPWFHIILADILLGQGRPEEARKELRLAEGPAPRPFLTWVRAALLASLGEPGEARRILAEREVNPHRPYVRATRVAGLYLAVGERERALALLERDTEEGERTLWIDYQLPWFDPVRDDPRFVTLLRELRLPTTPPGRLRTPKTGSQ